MAALAKSVTCALDACEFRKFHLLPGPSIVCMTVRLAEDEGLELDSGRCAESNVSILRSVIWVQRVCVRLQYCHMNDSATNSADRDHLGLSLGGIVAASYTCYWISITFISIIAVPLLASSDSPSSSLLSPCFFSSVIALKHEKLKGCHSNSVSAFRAHATILVEFPWVYAKKTPIFSILSGEEIIPGHALSTPSIIFGLKGTNWILLPLTEGHNINAWLARRYHNRKTRSLRFFFLFLGSS